MPYATQLDCPILHCLWSYINGRIVPLTLLPPLGEVDYLHCWKTPFVVVESANTIAPAVVERDPQLAQPVLSDVLHSVSRSWGMVEGQVAEAHSNYGHC